MIDKLELRVPRDTPFTSEFGSLYADVQCDPNVNPFHPSRLYVNAADLRQFGYSSVLHLFCRYGDPNHKVELLDTGKMTLNQMRHEVCRIFDVYPSNLQVMRIDLAADIPGYPVSWFQTHARAPLKRWVATVGKSYMSDMGMGTVETLYFGKRPNLFRIYDKIAEYRKEYRALVRNVSADAEIPTFESIYNVPENGFTLTRVERQLGGGRVPPSIGTVAKLTTLPDFNPFDKLAFLNCGNRMPHPEDFSDVRTFGFVMFLRDMCERVGLHRTRKWLNETTGGHANRYLEEVGEYLPGDSTVKPPQVLDIYRESVTKQLAA